VINRRTFLIGSVSGLSVLALSACTGPEPQPTLSPTPSLPISPTPSLVPAPSAMRRTAWSKDPFAQGSFSFPALGSSPAHRETLAAPISGRLFFAGEATSGTSAATVSGAHESGQRAARQVETAATAGERVIVVGAGMAGITAARILDTAGFDVLVIEARDRIGGRIDTRSDDAWPFPLELGASFVRDATSDPLTAQLAALGVAILPFAEKSEARSPQGKPVIVPDTGSKAVRQAKEWADAQAQDVSVADALAASGAGKLSQRPDGGGVSPAAWLQYQLATGLEPATGAEPDAVSSWYRPDPVDWGGERIVLGGYAKLMEENAEGLDLVKSSVVTRIAYDDKGVSLRLATGESMSADRVVVTVPLGVLKGDSLTFSPALPFAHRTAIAELGVGTLDKAWLRFDKPFWSTDATFWTLAGSDAPFPVWVNLAPLTGEPVLMGLAAAGHAEKLADLDDQAFTAAALSSLEPFADLG